MVQVLHPVLPLWPKFWIKIPCFNSHRSRPQFTLSRHLISEVEASLLFKSLINTRSQYLVRQFIKLLLLYEPTLVNVKLCPSSAIPSSISSNSVPSKFILPSFVPSSVVLSPIPTGQPMGQPTNLPMHRPTSQPMAQPTGQSTDQSNGVNHSIAIKWKRRRKLCLWRSLKKAMESKFR